MNQFVLGFVQDHDGTRVLLLDRNSPAHLKGQLNGVGGRIIDGQTPEQCMATKCFEQCELDIPEDEWILLGHWGDQKNHWMHVFGSVADLNQARSSIFGKVMRVYWHELGDRSLANGVAQMLDSIKPKRS